MEIGKQISELEKLGYRVVPERIPHLNKWEIIIEPWDGKLLRKRPGKIKRTGFLFTQIEINKTGANKIYYDKLEGVRMKLIGHLTKKRKLINV